MPEALVAFGGNLGDVRHTIDRAIAQLCDGTAVRLLKRSHDYETPPWGITDQPAFVNCAIATETALTPHALLARAHVIETALGRDRSRETRWGPRTIDIDLLTYGDLVLNTPELTLPHPRLFERAFMLLPLADLGPDRVIGGRRVGDALKRVDLRHNVRLPPRGA
jgi:2-amino-4-hydroxy-6-hydroxymethyldihydropteridine diphosphokinase